MYDFTEKMVPAGCCLRVSPVRVYCYFLEGCAFPYPAFENTASNSRSLVTRVQVEHCTLTIYECPRPLRSHQCSGASLRPQATKWGRTFLTDASGSQGARRSAVSACARAIGPRSSPTASQKSYLRKSMFSRSLLIMLGSRILMSMCILNQDPDTYFPVTFTPRFK